MAAITLLEFGKPVWVWVGLCVALATWQKEHWDNKCGSAAVAVVICSMYVLTMQLVTLVHNGRSIAGGKFEFQIPCFKVWSG